MQKLNIKISVIFAVLVAIFVYLSIGHSPIKPLNHQDHVVFYACGDFMADFFNVQRYIAERDPYFNEINGQSEKVYLPIAYCLLLPFNSLCDYANMSLQDCWDSNISVFSAVFFLLLSLFFLFDSLYRLNSKKGWRAFNTFLLLFSSIFLFSIERGNLIILTVAGINYFLAFYDSESIWLRRIGLFCLCMAAVLKIYPVVFGVLLLADRRYKDIAFCVVCGLVLAFVPFLFFKHGLSNVPRLIENVRVNSLVYGPHLTNYKLGIPVLCYKLAHGIGVSSHLVNVLVSGTKLLSALLALISVILAFFEKRRWMQIGLITLVVMLYPVNAQFYCGMYLLPFVMVFLNREEEAKWVDYVIAILLCLFMNPIQVFFHSTNLSTLFTNTCSIVLWMVLIIYSGIDICRKIACKKINN